MDRANRIIHAPVILEEQASGDQGDRLSISITFEVKRFSIEIVERTIFQAANQEGSDIVAVVNVKVVS